MEVVLCVKDWERGSHIPLEELVHRLLRCFPGAVFDREKGNALVQQRLDQLIEMGSPDVILESHKSQFDDVIFVSIAEEHWHGASATSYLQSIWPPLGDGVHFDVTDAIDDTTFSMIAQELKKALSMVLCAELRELNKSPA